MSTATEVIAVVTQVDGIINDMNVFIDNDKAEKLFIDTIKDYHTNWCESYGSEIHPLTQTDINIALDEGYWQIADTMLTIVHSSNNINVCACGTK